MKQMPEMGARAREEVRRLADLDGISAWKFMKKIGLEKHQFSNWGQGVTPAVRYLVLLGRNGADVKYIMLGRRGRMPEMPEDAMDQIGIRAYQEVERIAKRDKIAKRTVMKRMGAGPRTEYEWKAGAIPDTFSLIRLYYVGANLNYIFTGRK